VTAPCVASLCVGVDFVPRWDGVERCHDGEDVRSVPSRLLGLVQFDRDGVVGDACDLQCELDVRVTAEVDGLAHLGGLLWGDWSHHGICLSCCFSSVRSLYHAIVFVKRHDEPFCMQAYVAMCMFVRMYSSHSNRSQFHAWFSRQTIPGQLAT